MDPVLLAFLTTLAMVMVNRAAEIPVEKAYEALPSFFSLLFNAIRKKPELRKAVEQVSKNPSDPMAQREVQKQLQRLVIEEPAIALQLQKLVNLNGYLAPMNSITPDQIINALAPLQDRKTKTPLQMDVGYSLFVLAIDVHYMDHTLFPYHSGINSIQAHSIKYKAVVAMVAYAAFVLMRDEGIEAALAELPDDHILRPFRDFFHSSDAQHLRNAISTGSYWILPPYLSFFDGDWGAFVESSQFFDVCNRIRRFYERLPQS
ncbi:hypothetical protein A6A03_01010 [Chloroflexus islandicus]|uniref:Uncharacterized protein n=2 Tax=Chloroflexus islandicus TaxID=1707952 RepID=A0A178MF05_9CHLR|nr:hypothetical protein A6A03_01010 [Chloroflexus islandicus]